MQLKPSSHTEDRSSIVQPTDDASPPQQQHTTILIIGAGTWGLSTALHLARRGHKHITVLDGQPQIPSAISAGNDINKILELSSSAPPGSNARIVSDKLASAAIDGWRYDEVFAGLFHETGVVVAACSTKGKKALQRDDFNDDEWIPLDGPDDFRKTMPDGVLTGDFPGWKGYFKPGSNHARYKNTSTGTGTTTRTVFESDPGAGCGWVEARNALIRCAAEAKRLGVRFVTGERGRVTSLIYEDDDVKGAVVAYGAAFRADTVVLCAGANAAELLDMKGQLRPTAWTLAHIEMTAEEAKRYKDLPVLFNIERGFFIEPDAERHEMKICDEHPGYCNWETSPPQLPPQSPPQSLPTDEQTTVTSNNDSKSRSVPFAHHQIPAASEQRIRHFLHDTTPHLSRRPFSFARICWCADTPDRHFLIARHPEFPSLVLGVGASGHGFSYVPAVGAVIADCVERRMDPRARELFRWRPDTAASRDWTDPQNRFGPPGGDEVMDFQRVTEWTSVPERK